MACVSFFLETFLCFRQRIMGNGGVTASSPPPCCLLRILDINRTRDKIAQAYTHTQRHMNNAWSEMVSCSLCFVFYCLSSFC